MNSVGGEREITAFDQRTSSKSSVRTSWQAPPSATWQMVQHISSIRPSVSVIYLRGLRSFALFASTVQATRFAIEGPSCAWKRRNLRCRLKA
jgi:hypothetical protein